MNTIGSSGYFFLIDTERSRVNEARSAERKKGPSLIKP